MMIDRKGQIYKEIKQKIKSLHNLFLLCEICSIFFWMIPTLCMFTIFVAGLGFQSMFVWWKIISFIAFFVGWGYVNYLEDEAYTIPTVYRTGIVLEEKHIPFTLLSIVFTLIMVVIAIMVEATILVYPLLFVTTLYAYYYHKVKLFLEYRKEVIYDILW